MEAFLEEFKDVKLLNDWKEREAVIELSNALQGPVRLAMAKARGATYDELKQMLA